MFNFHAFKNDDWYGFAGCVRFNDGSAPWMGETDDRNVLLIGDKEGIGLYYTDPDEVAADPDGYEGQSYYWQADLNPTMCSMIMHLAAEMYNARGIAGIKDMGFDRCG